MLLTVVMLAALAFPASIFAQGSIFGTVQNANLTVPANGEIVFTGFVNQSDQEIHIETCVGAGYDVGNWFDDFQNYLSHTAGNPYDYYFINLANNEAFHLAKPIPNNSFQQDNIVLASASLPLRPLNVTARALSNTRMLITWTGTTGLTYHVYRRVSTSGGSFFRVDNPAGNLANPGVPDSFFVDATVDGVSAYDYMIIAQNAGVQYSAHSLVATGTPVIVAPTLVSVTPNSGVFSGGTPVVIGGTNFDAAGVTVSFGANNATAVTVVSPYIIDATTPPGSIGAVNVTVRNNASTLSATLTNGFTYNANAAPVLAAIGPKSVTEGQNLNFNASATDPDGTIPTLSALNVPTNATFVNNGNGTGTFNFNPTFNQAGVYNVTLIASDGSLADSEIVAITVIDAGNQRPILAAIGPKSTNEGVNLNFITSATDADSTIPIMSAVNVPANATFVNNGNCTGTFNFTPSFFQSGVYNVTFIASDGTLADSEIVAITVANVNQAPVLAPIGPKSVNYGSTLLFAVSATDGDSTIPVLTALNVPLNASFANHGNGTGTFTFTPGLTQLGVFNVTFIASDGALADSELVPITVINNANQPPALDSIGPKSVSEGGSLIIPLHATDDVGTPRLLFNAGNLKNYVFVDSGNGRGSLTYTPNFFNAGIDSVTFIATDFGTPPLSTLQKIGITTIDVNQPPVIATISDYTVVPGDSLRIRIVAFDSTSPSGAAPLVFLPLVKPTGSVFFDSTGGKASLRWKPTIADTGVYSFIVMCLDNGNPALSDLDTAIITVPRTNQAPVLDPIGPKSILESDTLRFRLHATDPDGTVPFFFAQNVPTNGSVIDSLNGAGSFFFTPNFKQSGLYSVKFYASDGSMNDNETVLIQVINNPQPPILTVPADTQVVLEGDSMQFIVSVADSDGTTDAILVDSLTLPINATFKDDLLVADLGDGKQRNCAHAETYGICNGAGMPDAPGTAEGDQ